MIAELAALVVGLLVVLWTLRAGNSPRLQPAAPVRRERLPGPAEAAPILLTVTRRADSAPEAMMRPERPAPTLEALESPAVVSLEPLAARPVPRRSARDAEPSRAEEHARLRRKAAAPAQTDPASGAEPFLDARELRRAMLMAEVLGPPRALRPLEEDRWG